MFIIIMIMMSSAVQGLGLDCVSSSSLSRRKILLAAPSSVMAAGLGLGVGVLSFSPAASKADPPDLASSTTSTSTSLYQKLKYEITNNVNQQHYWYWNDTTNGNDGAGAVVVDWNRYRYGTSTLTQQQQSEATSTSTSSTTGYETRTNTNNMMKRPTPSDAAALYPSWMEGYWAVTITDGNDDNGNNNNSNKFAIKTSFPQQSSRSRGSGSGITGRLGSCLSFVVPNNVGYSNNPSTFVQHYLKDNRTGIANDNNNNKMSVYEDVAYNMPRQLEAFWPQCKVTAIQVQAAAAAATQSQSQTQRLSPKCFVTGEGCTEAENPQLHNAPSTRFVLDVGVPTTRNSSNSGSGSGMSQSMDTTLLDVTSAVAGDDDSNNHQSQLFAIQKKFTQFNAQQDVQTFYKESLLLEYNNKNDDDDNNTNTQTQTVQGLVRVAAFLPQIMAAAAAPPGKASSLSSTSYDDTAAVALYDYRISMTRIDEDEANQY
jgi:hypothetical protein